jgi:hypothetical protein
VFVRGSCHSLTYFFIHIKNLFCFFFILIVLLCFEIKYIGWKPMTRSLDHSQVQQHDILVFISISIPIFLLGYIYISRKPDQIFRSFLGVTTPCTDFFTLFGIRAYWDLGSNNIIRNNICGEKRKNYKYRWTLLNGSRSRWVIKGQ